MQAKWIGLLLLAGCTLGCAQLRRDDPERFTDYSALRERLDILYEDGRNQEAIRTLDSALAEPELAQAQEHLFREILSLHLKENEVEKAQARFLESLHDPGRVRAGFGLIEEHLRAESEYATLAEWSETLRRSTLPEPQGREAAGHLLDARFQQGDTERIAALLPVLLDEHPARSAEHLLRKTLEQHRRAQRWPALDTLVAVLDAQGERHPFAAAWAALYRLRGHIGRAQLDEAVARFSETVAASTESGHRMIAQALRETVQLARQQNQLDKADALCDALADDADAPSLLQREAARLAVQLAGELEREPATMADRLERAVAQGGPLSPRMHLVRQNLYAILERGGDAERTRMRALSERLHEQAGTPREKRTGAELLLDVYFLTDHFDGALTVLQEDLPDLTEVERAILTVKVQAHKAIHEERRADAVGHLRTFMDYIKAADRRESEGFDPATRRQVSREKVLALNAERIATLWEEAGEPDKAAQARDEARGYYQAARERVDKGSAEYRAIQEKLDALQ